MPINSKLAFITNKDKVKAKSAHLLSPGSVVSDIGGLQYSTVALTQVAANVWVAAGDLT